MSQGQLSKGFLATCCDFQDDVSPILVILTLSDHAARLEAARQFHGTVMTEMQSPGDVSDGGPQSFGKAL